MAISVIIDYVLKKNGYKTELLIEKNHYASDFQEFTFSSKVTLQQFLNRIVFDLMNPKLSEQPSYDQIIVSTFMCMHRDYIFIDRNLFYENNQNI